MAWLAMDKNGAACIYNNKPIRGGTIWYCSHGGYVQITPESAERLAGKKMNWDDEAIEV